MPLSTPPLPEQRGISLEDFDRRADLFSMGSVMYEMVSGRRPFRAASTVAVLKRVCDDAPRPIGDILPDTPDWLCAIIHRLLEKGHDDRYQSAQEVADLLARCQSELKHNGKVTCVERHERNSSASPTRAKGSRCCSLVAWERRFA